MTASTRFVLAAAVVCAGIVWWWGRGTEPTPAAAPRATSPLDAAPGERVSAGDQVTTAPIAVEREAASAPATVPDWLAHPYPMQLELRVIDWLGLPVAGHTLSLTPAGGTLHRADVATMPTAAPS